MTYYDDIYELAVDQHYLITTEQARQAGIPSAELRKLAQRGRLTRIGHGLYRLSRYVPSEEDSYATAVAMLGSGARLYGESVIALLDLAPTNPAHVFVATPNRVRRRLPGNVIIRSVDEDAQVTRYMGIASQSVEDAILSARESMMPSRLRDAADRARELGYISKTQHERLLEELHGKTSE